MATDYKMFMSGRVQDINSSSSSLSKQSLKAPRTHTYTKGFFHLV